jgi:hypothetical protein
MQPLSTHTHTHIHIYIFLYEKFKVSNISRFKAILTSIWSSEIFLSENFIYDYYLQVYRPTCAGLVVETVETQKKVLNEILSNTENGHVI